MNLTSIFLKCNNHSPTNEFLDPFATNIILFGLFYNQLDFHSKTLIGDIFSDIISPEVISGNLISTMYDHLPQFMLVPNVFCNCMLLSCHICIL